MFIALSAVDALFKIPSLIPSTTIALDALPAFLGAMLLGGPAGAIIGAFGHLASAAVSGFPLTVPMHLVIACEMAVICYVTGWIAKKGKFFPIIAAVVAFVLNGFVAPVILIFWPNSGLTVYLLYVPALAIGSAVNAVAAGVLYYPIKAALKAAGMVKSPTDETKTKVL